MELIWKLAVDLSQICGGLGVLFAALEYRHWSHRRIGSALELRTIKSCDGNATLVSRITNVGSAGANILSVSQRDADPGETAIADIPSLLLPGESFELTFKGCNIKSCIWISYCPQDDIGKIRFCFLPLVHRILESRPFSNSRSPLRENNAGIRFSRWHHGDHLGEYGKNVVWISGQGNWKRTMSELEEIYADISQQGGKRIEMRLNERDLHNQ